MCLINQELEESEFWTIESHMYFPEQSYSPHFKKKINANRKYPLNTDLNYSKNYL